jgi:hypothetical protein
MKAIIIEQIYYKCVYLSQYFLTFRDLEWNI